MRYAAGVDLLIHEVAIVRPELISQPHIQRIMAHHTTAYEAGMVFSRTQPKLAAYSHLVFLASLSVPAASLDDLVSETRRAYAGPLAVGEDLMCFEINEAEVVGTRKSAKAFGIEISPALLARADEVIE